MVSRIATTSNQYLGKAAKTLGLRITWRTFCLIGLFILAAFIRIRNIQAPGELVEREYNSAITARDFYFNNNPDIEPWRQEMASALKARQFVLEPPVTEYIVSVIYRLTGKEELWYSRPITAAFWLIGGLFMYKLTKRLIQADAALIATTYYLLVPSGILVSRSFQPDALMMMMFLISLHSIVKYFDQPSLRQLLLAALLTGLTLLLRPLVAFAIFGVFISLALYHKRTLIIIFDRHFLLFLFIGLALPVLYYGYGIFISGVLRDQADLSFRPSLLLHREFWEGWFFLGTNANGYTAFLLAIPGFWLIRKASSQIFIIGTLIGYFFFGLFFTYHIHTHTYYHIQLIPVLGICIAPLILQLINLLKGTATRLWWLPVAAASALLLMSMYEQVRENIWSQVFENPGTARKIGEIVKHSDRAVFVAYHYGLPLEYYGEFTGTFWPRKIEYWLYRKPGERELSVQERLNNLGFNPEYFVITNFSDYSKNHQDLQEYLVNNCSVLAETDQYLIYNACQQ